MLCRWPWEEPAGRKRCGHVCATVKNFRAELGKHLTQALNAHFLPLQEKVVSQHQSRCGTVKLSIGLKDGLEVETVLIPMNGRTTVCVSSQVGCARGCTFCSTGQMKLLRNLEAHEILYQVFAAKRAIAASVELPDFRNIVFMGMGEPLNNFQEVERAIHQMTDPLTFGIGAKKITVSTVGPSPNLILKLKRLQTRIAWSIHAANDEVRRRLIPTSKHGVAELAESFAAVLRDKNEGLFVELTLIENENDSQEDAKALLACLAKLPGQNRVNLIPVNPTPETPYQAPSPAAVENFRSVLHEAGYFCSVRPARGDDDAAACGQLTTIRRQSRLRAQ